MSEVQATPAVETATPAAEPSLEELAKTILRPEPSADVDPTDPASSPAVAAATEEKPVDDKAERVSARIAAAKRAEIRAAREREELRVQRVDLERIKAETDARAAKYKLLEEDPVRAFDELKLDPKAFLEKLAGHQDPHAVTAREIAQLKTDLAKEREERARVQAEAERRAKLQELSAQEKALSEQFVEHVAESVEKYPHLTEEFTPDEIVRRAWQVAEQHGPAYYKQFGVYPDHDVIAEYLETEAKARAESRHAWRERLGKRAVEQPGSGSTPGDPKMKSPLVKGSGPRTLTSRVASQKASAPKVWSQEAADEESIRLLQTAFKT